MHLTAKHFEELSTKELYEILKARAEIFIMEQNIHYQDMDDLDYEIHEAEFKSDKGKNELQKNMHGRSETCGRFL